MITTVRCALAGRSRSKKLGHRHQPTAFKVHWETFSRTVFFLCQHNGALPANHEAKIKLFHMYTYQNLKSYHFSMHTITAMKLRLQTVT